MTQQHSPQDIAKAIVQFNDSLTNREREIYQMMCDGLSVSEIAERIFRVKNTARFHTESINKKVRAAGLKWRCSLVMSNTNKEKS